MALAISGSLVACAPDWSAVEDADGDGFAVADGDCDDLNAAISPGAEEIWYDGVDDNCDGNDDDADGDRFGIDEDCDDTNDRIHPEGEDVWYDGVDSDCDGANDYDADGDGHGAEGRGGADCDDEDPSEHPDAEEIWYDGIDQDCDGNDDDADGDGYPLGEDCDDTDASRYPSDAEEVWYDCYDDNCDGNDGDQDGDGYVPDDYAETCDWTQFPAHVAAGDCDDLAADAYPGGKEVWYDGVDQDCDGDDGADADGDGFLAESAGGDDCDDSDAAVNPDATESCLTEYDDDCDGNNNALDALGCDDWYIDVDGDGYGGGTSACYCDPGIPPYQAAVGGDCDDSDAGVSPDTIWYADSDGDGYGDAGTTTTSCEQPSGYVADSADCDDAVAAVNPAADELCAAPTGVAADEDCDGSIDEDSAADASTWYADADADGYGDAGSTYAACAQPTGYVADDTDCDDSDAEVIDSRVWYADNDADGYGDDTTTTAAQCEQPSGYAADGGDCDDADDSVNPGADELCAIDSDEAGDEDCDGAVDEDSAVDASAWYPDVDGDGYGSDADAATACEQPSGTLASGGDCDDADAAVNPDADEYCDGVDTDCDGTLDDDDALDAATWYADTDGDTYGDAGSTWAACDQPDGYVANADDCDDTDAAATDSATWYADTDGDGYGDAASGELSQCEQPSGYAAEDTDCDDTNSAVNPGAPELCDASDVDEDCDGASDDADPEGAADTTTWYRDLDADGYGDASDAITQCDQPSGYADNDADCDDIASTVSPDADEVCDTIDNDCDDEVDEGGAIDAALYYADADGDGYGDPDTPQSSCTPPAGYVADDGSIAAGGGDCDDADAAVNPDAVEVCDGGVDNDCNGLADDADAPADPSTWYVDVDGDGFGDPDATAATACEQPSGYVGNDADCDDAVSTTSPGADELCDGSTDEDCDGTVDESGAADVVTWYRDSDLDGYGNPASTLDRCTQPSGYTSDDTDCDDLDSGVNPGADEICDADDADEDCDGAADDLDPEGASDASSSGYPDMDGDGYGGDDEGLWCSPLADSSDCDDNDASVFPGATESDDSSDEDCDEWVDEDFIAYGDLIINEILADAQGVDEGHEWFEVYNTTSAPLFLDAWSAERSGGESFVISPQAELVVPPGSYLVFCEDASVAVGLTCDYEYGTADNGLTPSTYGAAEDDDFALDDAGDTLSIYLGGTLIDAVTYDTSFPLVTRYSLELGTSAADAAANDLAASWCQATELYDLSYGNYGTPGAENECVP